MPDGPVIAQSVLAYVRELPVPALRPGGVAVLDNLSSHKGDEVPQAIRADGARLIFLPPYSPDLSPIEQVFWGRRRAKPSHSRAVTWGCVVATRA